MRLNSDFFKKCNTVEGNVLDSLELRDFSYIEFFRKFDIITQKVTGVIGSNSKVYFSQLISNIKSNCNCYLFLATDKLRLSFSNIKITWVRQDELELEFSANLTYDTSVNSSEEVKPADLPKKMALSYIKQVMSNVDSEELINLSSMVLDTCVTEFESKEELTEYVKLEINKFLKKLED